jgi:two-component system phosphate regulon response regulator OmpR
MNSPLEHSFAAAGKISAMQGARILIVDDDEATRESTAEYLAGHGFGISQAADGLQMREAIGAQAPHLVLLDLNLPGEDGLTLARWLRAHHDLAIIMVTGAGAVVDRVVGLEVGADDYLAKPFDLRELRARIGSVLRRARGGAAPKAAGASGRLRIGRCELDLDTHQLFDAGGREVAITGMEFDLLRVFAENPNRVLSRDRLLTLTRNREWEPFDRSIDIRIARLRRKIEDDPAKPAVLRTVRGAGYMLVAG